MHLIFERSKGKFKPNCNILTLAWMPYYDESKFRSALFDYHQRQLINLTSSIAANGPFQSQNETFSNRVSGPMGRSQHLRSQSAPRSSNYGGYENDGSSQQQINPAVVPNSLIGSQYTSQFLNSRIAELIQRYLLMKESQAGGFSLDVKKKSGLIMTSELDEKYGRDTDFGWLVVGNVGKIVGVTLTSVLAPSYLEERVGVDGNKQQEIKKLRHEDDLMLFDEESQTNSVQQLDNQELELEQSSNKSNAEQLTNARPDRGSARSNYNLRGHLDEVILVKWNELYQKLATIDSKGNVLIWCKINDKFTIQTPFYNRTKSVADFKWSNDGKTALICYTDSFILVGSSSGQRHWHSMLNLDDYHITCASWTPNDDQLLLGVSNGNVVVIDLPHSELTELVVNQTNIRTMCWSSCDLTLKGLSKNSTIPQANGSSTHRSTRRNSTVVNHRRLSRDCSVFSRYRFCSQGPNSVSSRRQINNVNSKSDAPFRSTADTCATKQQNLLAIDFANSTIRLYNGGLDDPEPKTIVVNQESYIMNWSSDGEILAVAGFNIHTTAPSVGCLRCRYLNSIKFYNNLGELIYEHTMKYTRYPITAFTWAHEDTRLFVATGPRLHCAKVHRGIPSLSLLALSCLQKFTKLPDKGDMFNGVLQNNLQSVNLIGWQSNNCPIDIKSKHKEKNLFGVGVPASESFESMEAPHICYNGNAYMYRLPFKLQNRVDELFTQTIRQPYDENWSLNDIIWHVPHNDQRYYCTLVCYSSERDISSSGHQYRTHVINNRLQDNQGSEQNKIFVLYVEFLGSLIPILRARRVGFLKPEFVIFDPDSRQTRSARHLKVSDVSQPTSLNTLIQLRMNSQGISNLEQSARQSKQHINGVDFDTPTTSSLYYNEGFADIYSNLHMYSEPASNSATSSLAKLSDVENYYYYSDHSSRGRNRNLVDGRSYHQEPIALPTMSSPYLASTQNSALISQSTSYELAGGIHNKIQVLPATSHSSTKRIVYSGQKTKKTGLRHNLAEVDELMRIKSNIWGTKFKLINVKNGIIRQRSILGSVVYKASLLHLQPRQIFLNIRDMSNYCCLCSMHHHSKGRLSNQLKPLTQTIVQTNSGRSNLKSDIESRLDIKGDHNNKVLMPVGDYIRVAPKLDFNQTYRTNEKMNQLDFNQTEKDKHKFHQAERRRPVTSSNRGRRKGQRNLSSTSNSTLIRCRLPDLQRLKDNGNMTIDCYQGSNRTEADQRVIHNHNTKNFDDILTLSIGQGDQVRVEMSSLETEQERKSKNEELKQGKNLEDFLDSNRTLKSIQTITKMIVDLSSKANEVDDESNKDGSEISSPNKLVKLSEGAKASSPCSSNYIPPNTPVHRPRRVASKISGSHTRPVQTQSATTTPLKSINNLSSSTNKRTASKVEGKLTASAIPPPPPPMPISRRFSSSAKRFLDGSLRSLYNGYSATDLEQEDSTPLVPSSTSHTRSHKSKSSKRDLLKQLSQPCTPTKIMGQKQVSDLSSLKASLVQKLRANRSGNSEARKNFMYNFNRLTKTGRGTSLDALYSSPCSSPTSSSPPTDSEESTDFDSEQSDSDLDGTLKAKIKKFSSSVKDLREFNQRLASKNHSNNSHRKRKSICPNNRCLCAREFKLNNRPPVWNELSQVYQLDFGGRVTQESAKNLQIDFDGKLALQFGRIDRCTYTLDYKYPFNAVQAMAVALASLTQRLK